MSRARSHVHFRPEGAPGGKDPNEGFTDTRLIGSPAVMHLLFGDTAGSMAVTGMVARAADSPETEAPYQIPEECIDPNPNQLSATPPFRGDQRSRSGFERL